MFAPTAYLRWVMRFYGRVTFDLASSGMTAAPMELLGATPNLDDFGAWARLRERIARHNGVSVDEVLPALGTTHALWTAYASLLSPGDEALVEFPAYEPMFRIAEGLGAKVTRFTRSADEGFALDPDRVGRALTERTRVVAVTNLHNPSGVRASDDVLRKVAEVAERRGATLLVDEVYAPFEAMCGPDGTWPGSARKLGANVVVTSSLTKAYGVGSHRIGWVLGSPDVVRRGEDAQTSNLGHLPASWAAIGASAFDHLPALADRARGLLAGKRARVEAWVKTQPHLTWSAPEVGLYGLAIDRRGGDLTAAIERGAEEHDVLAVPGAFFEVPNAVRIAWSIDGAKLDEGLARLGRVLQHT